MNCWKKFWKIRKQDDNVKCLLLFATIGIGFFINILYNGFVLYQKANSPVEYVLSSSTQDELNGTKIKNLWDLKDIYAVSHQYEMPLEVKSKDGDLAFTCVELSQEYMEAVYGIKESSAMKVFYMNQMAYSQLKQGLDKKAVKNRGGQEELQICYIVEEIGDEETEQKEKIAKVVLVNQGVPKDLAYVFCRGDRSSEQVRVCIARQELEGRTTQRFQNEGFAIVNKEEVLEAEYQQEMNKAKMGYGFAISCICLACTWVMWKNWKRGHKGMY